jgi:hypothetical protein
MKLLTGAISHFYSVESKTSKQQLLEDFGEFPPTPLCCDSLKGEFEVVRVNGIGDIYRNFVEKKWLFMTTDADLHLLSPEAVKNLDADAPVHRLIVHFRSAFTKRLIFSIFFLLRIAMEKVPKNFGCFLALNKNKLQIIIKTGSLRAISRDELPIISHEHIHLLQFRNREKERKAAVPQYWRRSARDPQDILKEKFLSEDLNILEWLEKNETEARLHEYVLSFYRVHRELPMTIAGFLGLLASLRPSHLPPSQKSLISLVLNNNSTTVIEFAEYPDRELQGKTFTQTSELTFVLSALKTEELRYRFITEVLTVMYGNLLEYYGDTVASKSFLEGIARPNFYDDLYSE